MLWIESWIFKTVDLFCGLCLRLILWSCSLFICLFIELHVYKKNGFFFSERFFLPLTNTIPVHWHWSQSLPTKITIAMTNGNYSFLSFHLVFVCLHNDFSMIILRRIVSAFCVHYLLHVLFLFLFSVTHANIFHKIRQSRWFRLNMYEEIYMAAWNGIKTLKPLPPVAIYFRRIYTNSWYDWP